MPLDFSALMHDPIYAKLGVPATMTRGAGDVSLTVIDNTRPVSIATVGAPGEVRRVGPGAYARMPELTAQGITRAQYIDAVLTFNGRTWVGALLRIHRQPERRGLRRGALFAERGGRWLTPARTYWRGCSRSSPPSRISASAQRNNLDITDDQLPAAVVFDGDEETGDADDMGMRPPNRPTVVRMTPEIVIAQQSDEVGSDLTTLRREIDQARADRHRTKRKHRQDRAPRQRRHPLSRLPDRPGLWALAARRVAGAVCCSSTR